MEIASAAHLREWTGGPIPGDEPGSRGEGHGANVRHRANDGVHLARDTCSTRVIGVGCVLGGAWLAGRLDALARPQRRNRRADPTQKATRAVVCSRFTDVIDSLHE